MEQISPIPEWISPILHKLKNYKIDLVGSQFFGTATEASDWDFILQKPKRLLSQGKLHRVLKKLGFFKAYQIYHSTGFSFLKTGVHTVDGYTRKSTKLIHPWEGIIHTIYKRDPRSPEETKIDIMVVSSVPLVLKAYENYKDMFPINTREERHKPKNWHVAITQAKEDIKDTGGRLSIVDLKDTGKLSLHKVKAGLSLYKE